MGVGVAVGQCPNLPIPYISSTSFGETEMEYSIFLPNYGTFYRGTDKAAARIEWEKARAMVREVFRDGHVYLRLENSRRYVCLDRDNKIHTWGYPN